jgi:hypothetical protein
MRLSLMTLLTTLILASCASNIPTVVPSAEKYCPRPVRPVITQKDIWTMQELLQLNLTIIDYTLKLEATVDCWSDKTVKNK